MKALIGIDGSEGSFLALRQAAQLLSPERDQIGLYYSPPGGAATAGLDQVVVERGTAAIADALFVAAQSHVPAGFVGKLSQITGSQPPRTGLQTAADEYHADLIAVGARGIGPIERLLLGSVSHAVVHSASVPVLVARGGDPAAGKIQRVLVACDGSDMDREIAAAVGRLSWPAGAVGQVMTVIEGRSAGEVPEWLKQKTRSPEVEAIAQAFEREFEAEKQAVRTRLEQYSRGLPPPFQAQAPVVAEGHPAEQILNHVAAHAVDLVVLGARGHSAVARWLLGSTSDKVLNQAACSVLLVKHK